MSLRTPSLAITRVSSLSLNPTCSVRAQSLRSPLLVSLYVLWVGSLLILSLIRLRYLRLLPFLLSLILLLRVPVSRSPTRTVNHTYICMLSSLRSFLFPARCANSILALSIPIFKLPSVLMLSASTLTRRTLLLTSATSLATTGSRLALIRRVSSASSLCQVSLCLSLLTSTLSCSLIMRTTFGTRLSLYVTLQLLFRNPRVHWTLFGRV